MCWKEQNLFLSVQNLIKKQQKIIVKYRCGGGGDGDVQQRIEQEIACFNKTTPCIFIYANKTEIFATELVCVCIRTLFFFFCSFLKTKQVHILSTEMQQNT